MVNPVLYTTVMDDYDMPISYGTDMLATVPSDAGGDPRIGVPSMSDTTFNESADTITLYTNDSVSQPATIASPDNDGGANTVETKPATDWTKIALIAGAFYLLMRS